MLADARLIAARELRETLRDPNLMLPLVLMPTLIGVLAGISGFASFGPSPGAVGTAVTNAALDRLPTAAVEHLTNLPITNRDATLQVLLLAPEFYRPLRELGAQRHAAMEARPVAERIQSVLELSLPPGGRGGLSMEFRPASPTGKGGLALEFRQVTYAYPGASGVAVKNVQLRPAIPRDTTSQSSETSGTSAMVSARPQRPVMK